MAKKTTLITKRDEGYIAGLEDDDEQPHSTMVSAIGEGDIPEVTENEDGSATVSDQDDGDEVEPGDHMDNLALTLPETMLARISMDLTDSIERDRDARQPRDKQYADGIKRTGMGKEAPGGAEFEGASMTVHPVLTEACIDFSARAMKEIFPAKGPCRTQIIGEATRAKVDRANRKRQFMNWQLTTDIREYRAEKEQMLTQLPLGGSQYTKFWVEQRRTRARIHYEFVPIDDVLIPFAATDFYSAHRKTHTIRLTRAAFESRVKSRQYRPLPDDSTPMDMDPTQSQTSSDKVEGREDSAFNEDGLRVVYEIYTHLELEGEEGDEEVRPYVVTIDKSGGKVLAVYRNWKEGDEECRELDWMVEHKFIPWRGAYGIGMPHIIGGLAGSMTGALRALLDSAFISNMPAGLKLKGGRVAGQTLTPTATEVTEVEAGPGVDDIRKMFMPFPFNGPSPVLMSLLQWMGTEAKGVVGTAEERIADATSEMPMGTTLALIEQGSITYSSIHARQHESQKRELAILHRLNAEYLDEDQVIEELGDLEISRDDFTGFMDIIPVSDPNIFSDTQRFAQIQAVMGMAEKNPQQFKQDELISRALQLLNFPDYQQVLNTPAEAEKRDPCTENVEASKPETTLKAYPEQDHLEHMAAHVQFMLSPIFCANPLMAVPAMPKLAAHIKEHLLCYYAMHAQAAAHASEMTGGSGEGEESPLMMGLHALDQTASQELGKNIMPMLQKAEDALKQFAPPPPPDPHVQVETMKQQGLQAQAQADGQIRQAQIASSEKIEMSKLQQADAHHQQDLQVATTNAAASAQAMEDKNNTMMAIEQMRMHMDAEANIRNNQTNLMMAEMKAGFEKVALREKFMFDQFMADRNEKSDARSLADATQASLVVKDQETAHVAALNEQDHTHEMEKTHEQVAADVAGKLIDKQHADDTAAAEHERTLALEKHKADLQPPPPPAAPTGASK